MAAHTTTSQRDWALLLPRLEEGKRRKKTHTHAHTQPKKKSSKNQKGSDAPTLPCTTPHHPSSPSDRFLQSSHPLQTGRALHLVLRTQRRNIKARAKTPTGADYYRRVPFSRTPRPTILHLETRRLFASCCCITFSSSRTTGRTRGQEILCPVKTSRGARDPGKPRRPEGPEISGPWSTSLRVAPRFFEELLLRRRQTDRVSVLGFTPTAWRARFA